MVKLTSTSSDIRKISRIRKWCDSYVSQNNEINFSR